MTVSFAAITERRAYELKAARKQDDEVNSEV